MAEPKARREIASRSAEIWKGGGVSYGQAVDQALAEKNPTGSSTLGEKLLYALLNVDDTKPVPRRHWDDKRVSPNG